MKYIIGLLIILTSCQKAEIKPDDKAKYLLTVNTNASFREVKVNGDIKTPPVEVLSGDVVTVKYVTEITTPQRHDLQVVIYLDGSVIGSCNQTFQYTNTFNIK